MSRLWQSRCHLSFCGWVSIASSSKEKAQAELEAHWAVVHTGVPFVRHAS